MERRRLLIGSGVAFATALAGCTDLTSGDSDDPSDDDSDGSETDEKGDDTNDENGDEYQSIPGLADLEIDDPDLEIAYAKYDGADAKIGVRFEKKPDDVTDEELHEYAKNVGGAAGDSIDDRDWFEANIETITFTVYDRWDEVVVKFFLHVEWFLAYVDGDLSLEELVEKMDEERE